MASSSSTTSSVHKSFKYDVYVSFRGGDTRKTFVDHLYHALQRQSIFTFKDDEKIEAGGSIKDELFNVIEESKFFIIVFSKNYASSSWCLNELVKIMECHNTTDQTAYPVFYDVDPKDVRRQRGSFGEAFAEHDNKEEARKWREALVQAGNLAGWVLNNTANGYEAKFIEKMVEKISFKLRSTYLLADANLVGMEARVKKVLSSLETSNDPVRMIGIWGIEGAGKTTLARTVFNQISTQFEAKSFVENVRQVSRASLYGLESLQKKILSDVSYYHGIAISSSVFDGEIIIKERLRYKKVLIVLDDVDHIDQLEALAGEPNWFSSGSIIIVTTRDKHVLDAHRVKLIHTVELLSHDEAISLFFRHAFGGYIPIPGYKELVFEALRYAAGLPLTIKVLGSFLGGKDKLEWEAVLEKLKTIPLKETPGKLEASYMDLEVDYKEVFLDVACLLNGLPIDNVIRILESCGFYGRDALRVLEQKSLITINDDQYVVLHPLVEAMGKDIVRHLCPNRPNKHSRLWIGNEIEYVLAKDLGSEATKAIVVDSPVEPGSQIVTKGFGSMKKLRLLRVVSEIDANYDEKIGQISPEFPNALRYLSWAGYPLMSLPKTFEPNNLVTFEMPCSRVTQLWGGKQKVLSRLRFLDLRHSQLTTLDLGMTPSLETLDLEDCNHLVELHTPVGGQKTLVSLNLSGCSRIKSFMFVQRLESLEVLSLSRLYLKEFPDIIPGHCNSGLLELRFRDNNIEQLPSSIGNLKKLVHLDLRSCIKLWSLPGSICGLRHLRNLKLSDCDQLEVLPEDIDRLESLEKLNLSFARIKHLPDSICKLTHLKTLKLSFCRNLEKLPGDIGQLECLQKLILEKCIQVRDIPDSVCQLKSLKYLSLLDCSQLEKLPMELECLVGLEVLNVKGTRIRQLPLRDSSLICLEIHAPKNIQFMSTMGTLD